MGILSTEALAHALQVSLQVALQVFQDKNYSVTR